MDSGSQDAIRQNLRVCSLRKRSLFLCALANSGWNARVAVATPFFFFLSYRLVMWDPRTFWKPWANSSHAGSPLGALGVMGDPFFGGQGDRGPHPSAPKQNVSLVITFVVGGARTSQAWFTHQSLSQPMTDSCLFAGRTK